VGKNEKEEEAVKIRGGRTRATIPTA